MAHREQRTFVGLGIAAIVAVAFVLGASAPGADAEVRVLEAVLEGDQEVPVVATSAQGFATVFLDTATNTINWLIFHDVSGANGAHFHGNAFPGVDALVVVDIGAISGLSSPMVGSDTLTPGEATDLLAGRWYINVHSTTNPGGEIRGQVGPKTDGPLLIFPGTGPIAGTAGFDLTLFLASGLTPVGGSLTLNGADVTSFFLACMQAGTQVGGGSTFRCPVPGGVLPPGRNFLSAVVDLSNGSSVGNTANWSVVDNTEP